ncbi:uncharacterized protein LOC120734962 isoform X2 [Simochromis diagramma]|uniref:uncharacterized protein LOC120734962 isoform X2 n=1 Tax=Simochromis diagramma TaxID=43689 RepID=UPI001A7EA220|nr:uncharacterized protein LOC120734962 isoform X2 [Simochromis diagramma]
MSSACLFLKQHISRRAHLTLICTNTRRCVKQKYPGPEAESGEAWTSLEDFTQILNKTLRTIKHVVKNNQRVYLAALTATTTRHTSGLGGGAGVSPAHLTKTLDQRLSPTQKQSPVPAAVALLGTS